MTKEPPGYQAQGGPKGPYQVGGPNGQFQANDQYPVGQYPAGQYYPAGQNVNIVNPASGQQYRDQCKSPPSYSSYWLEIIF